MHKSVASRLTCCNTSQTHLEMMLTGSLAPPLPGSLPSQPRRCVSQTACNLRRAVHLPQQFSQGTALWQSCMQQRTGGRRCRGTAGIAPQALFQNMFKSDEGGKTRKKYQQRVDQINALESKYEQMDDEQLKQQTQALRSRVAGGEALESVLPEAFAVGASCMDVYKAAVSVLTGLPCNALLSHAIGTWRMHGGRQGHAAIVMKVSSCLQHAREGVASFIVEQTCMCNVA